MESKAVIAGVACRLPKSPNIEEFWKNLITGTDMIDETRWPQGLKHIPPRNGLIDDINKFDAEYFGYSDTQAHNMNPMLRHLLEVSYECIADSGLSLDVLQEHVTGVYTAAFIPDNDNLEMSKCANTRLYTTVSALSGHIMNTFSFNGPMATVDTACSSSVSALEMAVTDLCIGRCQFAFVTGVNLLLNPSYSQQMSELNMLSPVGQSRVFDASAAGYVRAEGICAVLLTRNLSMCKHIYASVVDIMCNCDGYKSEGITMPSGDSQATLMRNLYNRAGVSTDRLAYFEAHSTGTKRGDPEEVYGIETAICATRTKPLLIGSVKASMGHSEATSGLASLVKCLLIARHKTIPPQLNYTTPNPNIKAVATGKVIVVTKPTPLDDGLIGMNSFGFGGANGHIILEPYHKQVNKKDTKHCLVPLTARTEQEMAEMKDFAIQHRTNSNVLALLSTSILSNDSKRSIRGYLVTSQKEEETLHRYLSSPTVVPSIWLCLQDFMWDHVRVSADILDNPIFYRSIKNSQEIINTLDNEIILEKEILSSNLPSPISCAGLVVAVATLMGIVDCIRESGIKIAGVISCGMSEIVGGYLDGCLTKQQCLNIAYIIGKHIQSNHSTAITHKVYKVKLPLEDAYLLGPKVQVLSVLSDDSIVVAIHDLHVNKVLHMIHEKGGFFQELQHSVPLYCHLVDSLANNVVNDVQPLLDGSQYRSSHMLSAAQDYAFGLLSTDPGKLDTEFLRDVITSPVGVVNLMKSLPVDVTMVNVRLTNITHNVHQFAESHFVFDPVDCTADLKAVLKTIGEIHMLGHEVSADRLYEADVPLDVTAPSISHLVKWNHSVSWQIPEWQEFFCTVKDDAVCPYFIYGPDTEGIHTPLGLLLYHSWMAISQRYQETTDMERMLGIEFFDLKLTCEPDLKPDMLSGAVIQVQPGTCCFSVQNEGVVLMSGHFKLGIESHDLPTVQGYDVDINKNIKTKMDDRDILQKTEIMFEDSWVDFIDTILEFALQWLDGPLIRVMVDPAHHMKEVKECANILAVVDIYTGICKAGGVILQSLLTRCHDNMVTKTIKLDSAESSYINMLMAYSISDAGNSHNRVLIYQGDNEVKKDQVIGIVLITDEEVICREFPLSMGWKPEDLERFIPYLLAVYIMCDVAGIEQGQRILISPPLDTLSIYLMAIANEQGACVFTSSYDVEMRQLINNIFPYVRVLPGERLIQNMLTLTQGEGCELCLKFTSGDLEDILELTTNGGKMIQFAPLAERESVRLSHVKNGSSLMILPDLSQAVKDFIQKSPEEIQTFLYNMQSGSISKLCDEGFPELKGLKYSLDDRYHFLHPISFTQILSVIEEPGINLNDSFSDMMEADVIAMERFQNVIMTKPKDYSLQESRLVFDDKENRCESNSMLNIGLTETPDISIYNDDNAGVDIITIPKIKVVSPDSVEPFVKNLKTFRPTSTPMNQTSGDEIDSKVYNLHESYMETCQLPVPTTKPNKVLHLLPPLNIPASISNFKSGQKLDLVISRTPILKSAGLEKVLTPRKEDDQTLVPLNSCVEGKKVFIVHPITEMEGKKLSLILFDWDGCTSVIESKKIQKDGNIEKGAMYSMLLHRKEYMVEVLECSDDKMYLNNFEEEWSTSERSKALDEEKERRNGFSGGYLTIGLNCQMGLNGRKINVQHEGSGDYSSNISHPLRPPRYFEGLSSDQIDLINLQIQNADAERISRSSQTDKLVFCPESAITMGTQTDEYQNELVKEIANIVGNDKLLQVLKALKSMEPTQVTSLKTTLDTMKAQAKESLKNQEELLRNQGLILKNQTEILNRCASQFNTSGLSDVNSEVLSAFLDVRSSPLKEQVGVLQVIEIPQEISMQIPATNDIEERPLNASVTNSFGSGITISEIKNSSDMQNVPHGSEIRICRSIQQEKQRVACSKGNYAWTLAQAVFTEEELFGKNFSGKKGREMLSPRRRSAIQRTFFDTYGEEPGNFQIMCTGINTGIRNLTRKQKRNLSKAKESLKNQEELLRNQGLILKNQTEILNRCASQFNTSGLSDVNSEVLSAFLDVRSSPLKEQVGVLQVIEIPQEISMQIPATNDIEERPLNASVTNSFGSGITISEIKNSSDMQNVPHGSEIRICRSIQQEKQRVACSKGNYAWTLAQAVFTEEELFGKNFSGKKGREMLSPRRRSAIQRTFFYTYGEEPGNFQIMCTGINTGIRNLTRKQKRNLSKVFS